MNYPGGLIFRNREDIIGILFFHPKFCIEYIGKMATLKNVKKIKAEFFFWENVDVTHCDPVLNSPPPLGAILGVVFIFVLSSFLSSLLSSSVGGGGKRRNKKTPLG